MEPDSLLGGVIANLITDILKVSAKSLTRVQKVQEVLQKHGLLNPASDWQIHQVYGYALVRYAMNEPQPVVEFFKHPDVCNAFEKAFMTNELALLHREADTLIDWSIIRDEMAAINRQPRMEFTRFTLVFHEVIDLTRTPAQARAERLMGVCQLI